MKFKKVLGITISAFVMMSGFSPIPAYALTQTPDKTVQEHKDKGNDHRDGDPGSKHHKRKNFLIEDSARILNMDPQELAQQLKSGKSISDVAQSRGVDVNILSQKLQTGIIAKIDEAVKSGKLDQGKAAEIKSSLSENLPKMLSHKYDGKEKRHGVLFKGVREQILATLGLNAEELKALKEKGQTLAQIAQSKGVDSNKLKAAIQAKLENNIETAVKDGKLSNEEAAKLKAKLPEKVDRMMNKSHIKK